MGEGPVLYLIGDSMIEFFDWEKGLPACAPVNLGRSGETAYDTLMRLDEIGDRDDNPDLVLFMTGTNNVTMEDFAFHQVYDEIITKARALWPASRLVINSLLPMNLAYLAEDTVPRLNSELAQSAERLGVEFLDAFTPLSDGSGRAADGVLADEVHITDEGYRRWAEAIKGLLAA